MPTIAALPPRLGIAAAAAPRSFIATSRPSVAAGAVVAMGAPAFRGFGFARYGSSAPAFSIDAGVPIVLTMALDPAQSASNLRGPFAGFQFWDGAILRTPETNDVLDIRIGLNAIAMVAGGKLNIDAVIVGSGTTISNDEKSLTAAAGPPGQRRTFFMKLYAGQAFAQNGVQFVMTANVPVLVQNETLLVDPQSPGP